MHFRPGDALATDQRTGFKVLRSELRQEPVTGILTTDPDPEHPSLTIPDSPIGVEVVDEPTGPQQDVFVIAYGVVAGVNGSDLVTPEPAEYAPALPPYGVVAGVNG